MATWMWIGIGVMVAVGLVGVLRGGEWIAESAALMLVGLGLGLRRLTWGRPPAEDD
jgi:hypothetical protein